MKKDRWYFSYACAPSNSVVKIKAKPNANTTFRNGRKVLETIYVFMVEDAETLNDVDKPDAVSGYMPRGYQFGFVYKDLKNVRTMAHEIAHGAFHLRHTFDTHDFLADQSSTDNLMDYNYTQPTVLNHWQWADVHQPKSVRFKWLQDEAGAENIIVTANWITLDKTIEGLFLTPSGYPLFLSLTKGDKVAVLTDQVMAGTDELLSTPFAVYGFSTHGKTYFADIKDNIFHGYYDTDASVITYYEDNDGSTKNSLGEAMSSYTLVAWDGKSSFDEIIVDNNKWFEPRDDWSAYTASGYILTSVDDYTFRPCGYLLRKYANSPVMQSDVMRRAIEKDPCILNEKHMIHFAEVAPTKSEWMKAARGEGRAGVDAKID